MMQSVTSSSFVLGYRGGDRESGLRILTGADAEAFSHRDYGWLGPGIYFWENDLPKAREWAVGKSKRNGEPITPFVLGAVINLGNCLDLTNSENMELLKMAYEDMRVAGIDLPQNRSVQYGTKDRTLRYLNCAVIRHLHGLIGEMGEAPFDTVRGMFVEGEEGIPNDSPFESNVHAQIAVYNPACIKGFFLPRSM